MKENKLIDNKRFKKFFFYGIDNKRKIKEGILCFSSSKVYYRHSKDNWYTYPNAQFEKEIIQEANIKYRQFYRFVTLNDSVNNFVMNENMDSLAEELAEELQLLKKEKKVIDTEAGVFFKREVEEELRGGQIEEHHGIKVKSEDSWVKQIYDLLENLETLEKEDDEKYYEYWLLAKYARNVHRDEEDKVESIRIKALYENLKKEKIEERMKEKIEEKGLEIELE
jgi:hypothetical protein